MKELLSLYWTFFKIGLTTFGSGVSSLPMFEHELIDKKNWFTQEELTDFYALAQCSPGVVAVNTATYIGMKKRGFAGALFTTLGIITPSLLIIILLAEFLPLILSDSVIQSALTGIKVAVCALITYSVYKMIRKDIKDIFGWIILILSFVLISFLSVSPVFVIIGAAICGIIYLPLYAKHEQKRAAKEEEAKKASSEASGNSAGGDNNK